MRKAKSMAFFVGILFVIVLVSLAGGYYFYSDYRGQIAALEQQGQNINDKLHSLERSIDTFAARIENLNLQFKKYSDGLRSMEEKASLTESEKTEMFSKIDDIAREVENLKEFSAVVGELKAKVDNLKGMPKETAQKVDLGKISVDKPQ